MNLPLFRSTSKKSARHQGLFHLELRNPCNIGKILVVSAKSTLPTKVKKY